MTLVMFWSLFLWNYSKKTLCIIHQSYPQKKFLKSFFPLKSFKEMDLPPYIFLPNVKTSSSVPLSMKMYYFICLYNMKPK